MLNLLANCGYYALDGLKLMAEISFLPVDSRFARLYGGSEIENFEFSEEYEFIVTRAGHKRHAHRLSGGQQVLASMAFLMALSEVLSQLDFLILDEPTTHLDENRRKELVNVLENLKRVPQLIIVDHHPELLEAADTRFQVTLNNEGQSQVMEMSE